METIASVALAVILAVVQYPSPSSKPDPRLKPYADVIVAYQNCRDAEAMERVAALAPRYLDEAARSDEVFWPAVSVLPEMPPSGVSMPPSGVWTETSRRLAVAFLLHTRLARESLTEERRELHAKIVDRIFPRLPFWSPPSEAGALSYAVLAIDLQDRGRFASLAVTLSLMPRLYRNELPALLAVASLHQVFSTRMVLPDTSRWVEVENRRWARSKGWTSAEDQSATRYSQKDDGWGRDLIKVVSNGRRSNRERAITLFQRITTSWPDDPEAYVRLAALLLEDGRLLEADKALRGSGRLQKSAFLRYYEALIRGRLAERQRRPDEAIAAYDLAASLAPRAQTPPLATARLLFNAGQAARARELLRTRIPRAASQTEDDDPFWGTPFGQTWRRSEYFSRLDKVVRPCAQ